MTKLNKSILETVRHNEIFENIKKKSFYGIQPSRAFKTAFVGGQPGSGKSTLTKNAENAFSYNAVIIDPDKLREFHPDYRKISQQDSRTAASLVHPDASAWAKELFNEAVKGNYNLILDGTMGNTGKIISQCHQLREAGYHTEVHLMAVNSLVSRLGIQNRYEEQIHNKGSGRFSLVVNPKFPSAYQVFLHISAIKDKLLYYGEFPPYSKKAPDQRLVFITVFSQSICP